MRRDVRRNNKCEVIELNESDFGCMDRTRDSGLEIVTGWWMLAGSWLAPRLSIAAH